MRWKQTAMIGLVVVAVTTMVTASEQRRPHRWWQSTDVKALLELETRADSFFVRRAAIEALEGRIERVSRLRSSDRVVPSE